MEDRYFSPCGYRYKQLCWTDITSFSIYQYPHISKFKIQRTPIRYRYVTKEWVQITESHLYYTCLMSSIYWWKVGSHHHSEHFIMMALFSYWVKYKVLSLSPNIHCVVSANLINLTNTPFRRIWLTLLTMMPYTK